MQVTGYVDGISTW